ncbi:NAD(P)H-dependent oxidoreductase subunit E, partial [Paeniroseomonas aquatica]
MPDDRLGELPPRRKGRPGPRGAPLDPVALAEVQAALGDAPRRADLLIEHLHAIQDRHGGLRQRHLRALAAEMRLPDVVPFEVASFYAHFDLLADDAPPLPALTLRVCEGLPCAMAGGHELLAALRAAPPGGARVLAAPCMGACHWAPACAGGEAMVELATPARVAELVAAGAPPARDP